ALLLLIDVLDLHTESPLCAFLLRHRRPPRPPPFPYTTLFRSMKMASAFVRISTERTCASIRRKPCAFRICSGRTSSWCSTSASRSEEHTSELQSHLNLVCRLLLEKKKNL